MSNMSDDPLAAVIAQMREWCADNSGHYHEDDVEETVKRWADELEAALRAVRDGRRVKPDMNIKAFVKERFDYEPDLMRAIENAIEGALAIERREP